MYLNMNISIRMHEYMGCYCSYKHAEAGRHDWFYYTSTKCAIPDDINMQKYSC